MKTMKQLLEERKQAFDAVHAMRETVKAEERQMTSEERESWDKANADFDDLSQKIEDLQKEERMAATVKDTPGREDTDKSDGQRDDKPTMAEYRQALNAWARSQVGCPQSGDVEAMERGGMTPGQTQLRVTMNREAPHSQAECRAADDPMQTGVATEGSEYVPQDFRRQLESAMLTYGAMRSVVTILRTDGANALPMPTVNDTGNSGAFVSEGSDSGDNTSPTTGSTTLNAYKISSKPVLVSYELLRDSAFDMAAMITGQLGMRLARKQNNEATLGTASKFAGYITGDATTGKTCASATAFTFAELNDLLYSVDDAYAQNGGWMLNRQIMSDVRTLKDDANRFIFQPDATQAAGGTLLGHPVVFNNDMVSSLSASAIPVLFGDFSKYMLREVRGIRVHRLTERYREEYDSDGFVAFLETDGALLDAGTNPVKSLVMAAGA